jgi:protein gp37
MGTSIESGDYVGRANRLIGIPAAVHFISYEPALGPLDALDLTHIEWVIFGGESGPKFRAPAGWQSWARAMRDRCADADVAFFFKQSPAPRTELGTTLDGRTTRQFPTLDTLVPSVPSVPSSPFPS